MDPGLRRDDRVFMSTPTPKSVIPRWREEDEGRDD
jgi:hypothetical protein